jgi:hypothetical protein
MGTRFIHLTLGWIKNAVSVRLAHGTLLRFFQVVVENALFTKVVLASV